MLAQPAAQGEPFGTVGLKAPEGAMWAAWRRIRSDFRAQLPRLTRCLASADVCNAAERLLRDIIKEAKAKQGRAKIEIANVRVNAAIRYTSDERQWGVADAWSAPLGGNQEGSLNSGLGDCEDYSIAKYVVLRLAGLTASDLRVVLLRDNAVRIDHAVLAARDGERWLILDNRWNALFDDRELEKRFTPLFVIDADGVSMLARPFRISDQKAKGRPASRGQRR